MNDTRNAKTDDPARAGTNDAGTVSSFHVLGSRQLGGADQFYVRLVEALTQAGHPTLAVHRPTSPIGELLRNAGVAQRPLPLANQWDVYSMWRLRRWVKRERPMVVQTYMGRATRLTRIPPAWPTVHIARLGGYYKIRGYYEHAHAWVGNTQGICDYLVRSGLPADRVYHIGNFVPEPEPVNEWEQQRLRQRFALPDGALVVFALARLMEKKGIADLLEAFARLPKDIDGRPLHLIVAGDGPLREPLQAQARSLGIEARVNWPGWVHPGPYFHLADLAVCPSRHEPLGNVILEAWSYDVPIVSTRNLGASELIEDGVNGRLATVQDPDALARCIRETLALPEDERRSLTDAARATLERHHTRAAVVARYLELYRELIGQRGIA